MRTGLWQGKRLLAEGNFLIEQMQTTLQIVFAADFAFADESLRGHCTGLYADDVKEI
jgi:hypothetical protein